MNKRVVITGSGAVTPFGIGVPSLMKGIEDRKSAVSRMNDWDWLEGLRTRVGAKVLVSNEKEIPRKFRRSMSPMSIFAVQAVSEALEEAHIEKDELSVLKAGCIVGSTTGSSIAIHDSYQKILGKGSITELKSTSFFKGMSHAVASNIALYFGIKGLVLAPSAACASSLQAIGLGFNLIKAGQQKVLVCGGAEELHPVVAASFDILEGTSINFNDSPSKTPRPFDRDRDGVVCAEGAGILILEEYEHAVKRRVPILGEIVSFSTNNSNTTISQSSVESLVECMNDVLTNAGLQACDIGYINAHATGTIYGDKAEAMAIREVFQDSSYVSSLKGYFGHTLGASGAIELAASLQMMNKGIVYPGLNLDNVDEDCDNISHLKEAQKLVSDYIMKNAFAFGGINASIIARRMSGQ